MLSGLLVLDLSLEVVSEPVLPLLLIGLEALKSIEVLFFSVSHLRSHLEVLVPFKCGSSSLLINSVSQLLSELLFIDLISSLLFNNLVAVGSIGFLHQADLFSTGISSSSSSFIIIDLVLEVVLESLSPLILQVIESLQSILMHLIGILQLLDLFFLLQKDIISLSILFIDCSP